MLLPTEVLVVVVELSMAGQHPEALVIPHRQAQYKVMMVVTVNNMLETIVQAAVVAVVLVRLVSIPPVVMGVLVGLVLLPL
tara:strand:- start:351 stop:593 length:243 start_codon:yes stop_codon:yes gene_type:complete